MLNRPDPDQLLQRVQDDEARQQRGQLKIFLGAAAGVGKTYAMLESGRGRLVEDHWLRGDTWSCRNGSLA